MLKQKKIAILGLGYVGLPLAVEFAKHFLVIGFDINIKRVEALKAGADNTNEIESEILSSKDMKDLIESEREIELADLENND